MLRGKKGVNPDAFLSTKLFSSAERKAPGRGLPGQHQAELLGAGAIAGVLLELDPARGRRPRDIQAQARVVGHEGVVAVGLEVGREQLVGVAGAAVVPSL